MMRYIFLILLFSFFCYDGVASNNIDLSYNDYVKEYAKDATSKAIIKVFFENASGEKKCNYKKLEKALDDYYNKNTIDENLRLKVDQIKQRDTGFTEEAYSNMIKATLKKINE